MSKLNKIDIENTIISITKTNNLSSKMPQLAFQSQNIYLSLPSVTQ